MSNIEDRIILMNLLSRNGILMDVLHSEFDEQPGTILENNLISSDQSNLSDKIMNHVTLKIDVSHTDHGHLIGRYGCNIKAVVMKTLCHIHFPDSNKNNLSNKSNQVSISGSLRNVEKARRIIRDLLPITFTFEIPYLINENLSTNQISPLIQQIQNVFKVEITFRNNFLNGNRTTVVIVKGLAVNSKNTKDAIEILMDKCLSLNIDNLQVNMYIEMDSNNPSMLTSQTLREKLKKLVYEATGAKINYSSNCFSPSASSRSSSSSTSPQSGSSSLSFNQVRCLTNVINSSSMNNSSGCNLTSNTNSSQHIVTTLDHIHIYGSVNSVLQARQLIMNLLPVVLTLNVNTSEGEWLESLDFKDLCHHHDINIIIRDKRRKSVKSVVIRTTEKNICSLYFVCRLIGRLLLYHSKLIGSQAGSSNCLASVTDQPKSDKLWGINMFKSDILAEIQSFSNSTEDRKLVCDSKVNSEQLILRSPITLSSLSNQSTNSFFTSNTNNNNNSGSSYNNNNQFTTQKADACYRADYLRLMSYIMNTKLELTSYCNNMIRNQYEGLNENPIAQTKEIGVDDQLSTQLTNMPVNDEIQKGYEIPPRML